MNRVKNKVAVVTGAAGGIGLAAAQLFNAEGAKVVLIDQDETRLKNAVESIESDDVSFYAADLTDDEQVHDSIQFALDNYNRIDIAVFNAGIAGANQALEEFPIELFDSVIAVNLRAAWLGMRAVVPGMKEQKSGSIVFTSSIQGLSALAGTTAYTTSKHALVGMMKGAALELAPYNVRVNTVHPGYVDTPMMDSIHQAVNPQAPESFKAAIAKSVPMNRYADPKEIAELMLFLGSDASSYSTGSCFVADGGILAALPSF